MKKSEKTLKLERDLIRRFRGLEPLEADPNDRNQFLSLPPSAREVVLLKEKLRNPYKVEMCVICCIEFKVKEKVVQLECLHMFHKPCLQAWFVVN